MLTIDGLRTFGANVDEGVKRCAGKEDLYLKLVAKIPLDQFEKLEQAMEEKNYDQAYECAHALKGVLANLEITPLGEPMTIISDDLKAKVDRDYSEDMEAVRRAKNTFLKMFD